MVIWKKLKQIWSKISTYVWVFVNIYVIITLYERFGAWGLLGLVLIFTLILAYRMLRKKHRETFLNLLRLVEGAIWGKPLDKEMWNEGEIRNTKVKVRWKRTKKQKE